MRCVVEASPIAKSEGNVRRPYHASKAGSPIAPVTCTRLRAKHSQQSLSRRYASHKQCAGNGELRTLAIWCHSCLEHYGFHLLSHFRLLSQFRTTYVLPPHLDCEHCLVMGNTQLQSGVLLHLPPFRCHRCWICNIERSCSLRATPPI